MLVITDMRGRCANVAAAAPSPASYPPGSSTISSPGLISPWQHNITPWPHISIPGKYSGLALASMGRGKLETLSQTLSGCQPCITMLADENQILDIST